MKHFIFYLALILALPAFGQREEQTDITDWKLYAPLELLDSVSSFVAFGVNNDVDTGTAEDVWPAGGTYPIRSAAAPMEVSSADDDDDVDSTGCTKVVLIGLDSNLLALRDTVTMNGTSTVESADTFYYVNEAYCLTAGSSRVNEGDIDIVHKTDATSAAYILAGAGKSQQAIYAVANDEDLLMTTKFVALDSPAATPGSSPSANVGLFTLDISSSTSSWQELVVSAVSYEGNSYVDFQFHPFTRIVGPAIVKLRVTSSLVDDQEVAGQIDGYAIKKNAISINKDERIWDRPLIHGF